MKKLLLLLVLFSCNPKPTTIKQRIKTEVALGKIREDITKIIEYQKEMGYHMPTIIQSPASQAKIKETEKKLDLKFNQELKELYLTINGVYLDGITPSGKTGIIPIHDLMDLDWSVEYYNSMDWQEHKEMYEIDYDLGEKLFPFITDGAGNSYWVDLNEETENYGRLYWTNTFGDQPDYLFNSLTDFFDAILKGYETKIFSLDSDGYLDCDYKKWGQICYRLDPSIPYWQEYVNEK
ncbi:SMI1/KNR4 family protein [Rufibacter immobilis]|uniref:SMI1/KNR4 family protein n=1 Tax=Rufibacter immobilis TaxID=1348778 RepID=UPI0035F04B18